MSSDVRLEVPPFSKGGLGGIEDIMKKNLFPVFAIAAATALVLIFSAREASSVGKGKYKVVAVIAHDEVMGRLKEPSGVFYDASKERLYVADTGNNRLVSFDKEFSYLSELTDEGFSLPVTVLKTEEGDFLVLDAKEGVIKVIDMKQKKVSLFDIKGVPVAKEKFIPGRFTSDESGNIYVIDRLNRRIVVVKKDGSFDKVIAPSSPASFYGFNDVKAGGGSVYGLDTVSSMVYVFDAKGSVVSKFGVSIDPSTSSSGGLSFPISLAASGGFIYVLYRHSGEIGVFDGRGALQYVLSDKGFKEGELYTPSYISISADGLIYVVDGGRVQVFREVE